MRFLRSESRVLTALFVSTLVIIILPVCGKTLRVPYYWQADSEWCWAASAAMVAGYYRGTDLAGSVQAKPWWLAADAGEAKDGLSDGFGLQAKSALETDRKSVV